MKWGARSAAAGIREAGERGGGRGPCQRGRHGPGPGGHGRACRTLAHLSWDRTGAQTRGTGDVQLLPTSKGNIPEQGPTERLKF